MCVRCSLLFVPRGRNNLFVPVGKTFLTHRRGGANIYVGGSGGYDDVDEEMSKANILVSEASNLPTGARIFRGP